MRISGLATGMDIDQIVADLMRAERLPVDKMLQERQTLEWKMEDYREINRKLNTFRNNIFDGVIRQANMLAKTVSSTKESAVSATGTSNAGNMSMRIKHISQLAEAASYNSSGKISGESKVDTSATLRSQRDHFDVGGDWAAGIINEKTITQTGSTNVVSLDLDEGTSIHNPEHMIVKVNGRSYKVVQEVGENGLQDNEVLLEDGKLTFKDTIDNGTNVSVTYMTENDTETFTIPEEDDGRNTFQLSRGGLHADSLKIYVGGSNVPISAEEIETDRATFENNQDAKVFVDLETGRIEFKDAQTDVRVEYAQEYTTARIEAYDTNGNEVSDAFIFTANQSLDQVFNELNRSHVGVNAFYDEYTDKVNVTRTETGRLNKGGNEITFGGFFTEALRLDGEGDGGAKNAKFILNGLETERQSNTFTVSGMTITLKETTGEDEVVTLNSATDTDTVFDTIKDFVEEYNELIDFVNGKLTEDRHRDYAPLTDEQKEALSDREVERWEERARSGLLRNDQALRTPFDRMRVDVYSSVSGELSTEFAHLSSIGITTTNDYMARGKLEIDEDKLRAAIEADAEGVYQLFAADGDTFEEKGIARRMRETLDHGIDSLAERAGGFRGKVTNDQFTLGRSMNRINDRISNFERRLEQIEARYWRQFNAMEAAVQQANAQAESLFSQLYGNQGF